MKNINIEDIWSEGLKTEPIIESIEWPVKNPNRKSRQLVDRIRQTGKREHVIFLVLVAVSIPILLVTGHFKVLAGILLFALAMIWKYNVEMGMLNSIQLQDDTLVYLKGVQQLIKKFMTIYKNVILFLTPVAMMLAIIIFNSTKGVGLIETISESAFWIVVTFSSILSIILSRLWLKLWVYTFYGKKLKELDQMIIDLQEEE